MKKLFLALTVVLAVLVGCQAQPKPEEMLAAMEDALNGGDVDAAMAFFADDAVVKLVPALPPGSPDTYTGAEEIRGWFEELVAMSFEIHVEVLQVEGDTVTTRTSTWMDATREMGVAPLVATEVYTIRDGKIRGFTWTISDDSLAKIQAAMAPPPEAIIGTWSWDTASTYFQFNEDGTYRHHLYLDELEQEPADVGQYRVEGTELTFISGDETRVCNAGERGSYQIAITQEGKLQLVLEEDECGTRRAPSRNPQLFTRVALSSLLPTATPPAPTAMPVPPTAAPTAPPVALTTAEDLVGVWERGERRLTFRGGGTGLAVSPGEFSCPVRFWFEGNRLHIEDKSDLCCPEGQIGVYEVQGVPQDYLVIALITEACKYGERQKFLTGTWEWISSP